MSRSTLVTIADPLLEPYFITKDDNCFTVHERVQPKKAHFRTKKNGTEYSKPQGYYPNLEQALIKITQERVFSKSNVLTLQNIVNSINQIQEETKQFIYERREKSKSDIQRCDCQTP